MIMILVRLSSFMVSLLSTISIFYGECSGLHNELPQKAENVIQTECGFSESDKLHVTEYYKLLATAESKRFNVKISLSDGKIKTVDIFNGIEIENPFYKALSNKRCKVIDHSDFLNAVGLKTSSLYSVDMKRQIERLGSSSPLERGLAVVILGEMGPRAASAAPELIKLLGDNTNLLEEEGPLDGLWPAYYSKTRNEKEWPPAIDSVCAWAISKMGQLAAGPLIDALNDEDWHIKRYAIDILGNTEDYGAVEPLIAVLKDENWFVQELAIRALRNISDQDPGKWQRGKPATGPLIAAIRDKDEDLGIRSEAARVLGEIKGDNAVEALITLLDDPDISFTLRKDIVIALGKTGDSRAVKCLQAALNDFFIKDEAEVALNKISGRDFIKDVSF